MCVGLFKMSEVVCVYGNTLWSDLFRSICDRMMCDCAVSHTSPTATNQKKRKNDNENVIIYWNYVVECVRSHIRSLENFRG